MTQDLAPHANAIKEVRGWRFADALTDSEIQVVLNIAEKYRTPTPDLGVAVEALRRIRDTAGETLHFLSDAEQCKAIAIEALKSLGGE